MEIVHFSDLHIGVNDQLDDPLDMLDCMVEYTEDIQADLVVFAGDAYHIHDPNYVYRDEFAMRIEDLSNTCPVVLVPGNHDQSTARRTGIDNSLDLGIFNTYTTVISKSFLIETKSGNVHVACLPYPSRTQWLDHMDAHERSPQELSIEVTAQAIDFMSWDINRYKCVSILVAHLEPYTQISINDLRGWDYVALGHKHKYHELAKNIVYSGSLGAVYGIEKGTKGFCHVTISNDQTDYQFVEVK